MELSEFLSKDPWPAAWLALGAPLDYLWTFDLDAAPERLWPLLADTSSFNQRLGVSEMKFVERGGKRYGSTVNGGFIQEWEEVPWEWEAPRGLSNVRLYTRGFAHLVRARYRLEPLGAGRSRLQVYFGWVPRTFWGRFLLRYGMKQLEQDYRRVLRELVESLPVEVARPAPASPGAGTALTLPVMRAVRPLVRLGPQVTLGADATARLAAARADLLREAALPAPLVERLVTWAREASDEELARIRLKVVARQWGVSERALLLVFLHATRKGLTTLSWDVICPHCRGARAELEHLGDVPKRGTCDVCTVEFDATSLHALEVAFHIHPAIRKITPRSFCSAEPSKKPHILLQTVLQPGEQRALPQALTEGRYRLRVQGEQVYTLVDARADAAGDVRVAAGLGGEHHTVGLTPTLTLENPTQAAHTFVLERADQDRDALRPADLLGFQGFRDLFSKEAVSSDVQLDIGTQTILFTDLVGSTKFYEAEGDTVAFAAVRKHFVRAYEAVKANDGVIVKTIGDAVMAAFNEPAKALQAAHDLQRHFDGKAADNQLRLRITLHTGPCLAVNLHGQVDYFGSTVNLAAKIQSVAEAGQVAWTEAVMKDAGVEKLLASWGLPVARLSFVQKWSGKEQPAFRVDVS